MAPIFDAQFDQYRLGTRFLADHYEHDIACESRIRAEKWRRVRCLGEGSSAKVWLEQDEDGKCRAVKQISKPKILNERELVALTKLGEVRLPKKFPGNNFATTSNTRYAN